MFYLTTFHKKKKHSYFLSFNHYKDYIDSIIVILCLGRKKQLRKIENKEASKDGINFFSLFVMGDWYTCSGQNDRLKPSNMK